METMQGLKLKAAAFKLKAKKADYRKRLIKAKAKDLELRHTMLAESVTNKDKKIRELNLQVDELGHQVATTERLKHALSLATLKLDNREGELKDLPINDILKDENEALTIHNSRMEQEK